VNDKKKFPQRRKGAKKEAKEPGPDDAERHRFAFLTVLLSFAPLLLKREIVFR
jgi:hypothetical protein